MAPEPLSLPVDDWKGWLEDRARGQLRHAGDAIAALKDATPADEAILQVWNDAGIALDNAAAACSLLSVVHPDRYLEFWNKSIPSLEMSLVLTGPRVTYAQMLQFWYGFSCGHCGLLLLLQS